MVYATRGRAPCRLEHDACLGEVAQCVMWRGMSGDNVCIGGRYDGNGRNSVVYAMKWGWHAECSSRPATNRRFKMQTLDNMALVYIACNAARVECERDEAMEILFSRIGMRAALALAFEVGIEFATA